MILFHFVEVFMIWNIIMMPFYNFSFCRYCQMRTNLNIITTPFYNFSFTKVNEIENEANSALHFIFSQLFSHFHLWEKVVLPLSFIPSESILIRLTHTHRTMNLLGKYYHSAENLVEFNKRHNCANSQIFINFQFLSEIEQEFLGE